VIIRRKTHLAIVAELLSKHAGELAAICADIDHLRKTYNHETSILRQENIHLRNKVAVLNGQLMAQQHAKNMVVLEDAGDPPFPGLAESHRLNTQYEAERRQYRIDHPDRGVKGED
jgi:hypothetical protein